MSRQGAEGAPGALAESAPRIVAVREKILKANDLLARRLRARFAAAGTRVVSLVSSPGAGKTTLLEALLPVLAPHWRMAVLVGDLATENDAVRLRRAAPRIPVRQIATGSVCHLDAGMIVRALDDEGWDLAALDLLWIENVGNLVCPAAYDLGEQRRWVLLSATEGEDKPSKYPGIFQGADLTVFTKMDLAAAVGFDAAAARVHLQAARPGMPWIEIAAKTGQGLERLAALLPPAAA
ncbi:MAG: hydrogenase nickel incorporation protein HypB [Terriglobales bacterium]